VRSITWPLASVIATGDPSASVWMYSTTSWATAGAEQATSTTSASTARFNSKESPFMA